jgi:hypothetical protein
MADCEQGFPYLHLQINNSPVHKITRIKKMAMSRWQNPIYAMNDYQLNLEKVLEKKLIAAKRVKSLNYEASLIHTFESMFVGNF